MMLLYIIFLFIGCYLDASRLYSGLFIFFHAYLCLPKAKQLFLICEIRKKPKLLVNYGIIEWQIYLDVAMKVKRDFLLQSLCLMKLWQNIFSTVSS